MRWLALLLVAAPLAADPFDPPPKDRLSYAGAGAYGRWAESLALQEAALERNPLDLRALERAITILERFAKSPELKERVRKTLKRELAPEQRAALRGLLGRLLVTQQRLPRGIIVFGNNPPRLTDYQKKSYQEAAHHLVAALAVDKKAVRARGDLAHALEALDKTLHGDQIRQLRAEAAALSAGEPRARPEDGRSDLEAIRVRGEAEKLEQRPDPDHTGALLLRQRALVLEYCSYTIAFDYTEPVYGPVSLLAERALINRNLRRSYLTTKGDPDYVEPLYYPATPERKLEIVAQLAKDTSASAAAVLLRIMARSRAPDPLADAALESLVAGKHAAGVEHLPRLLAVALFSTNFAHYSFPGQQRLVEAARRLEIRAAAPVLAAFLQDDTNLDWPRNVSAALGELGRPEDAAALLAIARDRDTDVYFRRQAIGALGRLAPARLDDVPAEPHLELALAAARYRGGATESLRGRILNGLQHEHEADEAARFCAELRIREAVPAMETFLARHPGHYATEEITAAILTLLAR